MRILILDTETIGKVSQTLLNVGWKVVDLNIQKGQATTITEHDYIITEIFNNKLWCINDDFVGFDKWQAMESNIKAKKSVKRKLASVMATLHKDIVDNGVLFGYAYNCQFDANVIDKNCKEQEIVNPLGDLPIHDIWGYAYDTICNTEDYKEWGKANEMLTATQRFIATSVEAVARYLYGDADFKEEHLALSDAEHELAILCECVRRGADITRPGHKPKNIESDKIFHACIVKPNGERVEFDYKRVVERNGNQYYH